MCLPGSLTHRTCLGSDRLNVLPPSRLEDEMWLWLTINEHLSLFLLTKRLYRYQRWSYISLSVLYIRSFFINVLYGNKQHLFSVAVSFLLPIFITFCACVHVVTFLLTCIVYTFMLKIILKCINWMISQKLWTIILWNFLENWNCCTTTNKYRWLNEKAFMLKSEHMRSPVFKKKRNLLEKVQRISKLEWTQWSLFCSESV